MTLAEKILMLRKQRALSQEELAEKLGVSRQAVSRWENGSALPDASNLLQLSRLFGVTADYLLGSEPDQADIPAAAPPVRPVRDIKRAAAGIVAAAGLLGNLVIYILSRMVEVMVPAKTLRDGEWIYTWSAEFTGRSYKYFIWEYDLELLTALLWLMVIAGAAYLLIKRLKTEKISSV